MVRGHNNLHLDHGALLVSLQNGVDAVLPSESARSLSCSLKQQYNGCVRKGAMFSETAYSEYQSGTCGGFTIIRFVYFTL